MLLLKVALVNVDTEDFSYWGQKDSKKDQMSVPNFSDWGLPHWEYPWKREEKA